MEIDINYQTPIEVCQYMANLIPIGCSKILEPTPGIGNLVSVMEDRGFDVFYPSDFFTMNFKEKYDCVVMNPPFSSKSAYLENAPQDVEVHGMKLGYFILKKCMEMSDNIIALMPWYTLSDSDVRMRFLREYGIKSVTPLPRKTFQYARIQTVIIELEKGFKGQTEFKIHLI